MYKPNYLSKTQGDEMSVNTDIQKFLVPAVTEYITNNPGVDSVDITSHFKLRVDITLEAVSELQKNDIIIRKELCGTRCGYFIKRSE